MTPVTVPVTSTAALASHALACPAPTLRAIAFRMLAVRLLPIMALLCAGTLPAVADPALFVARAPGVTAYLFGSIHALRPGVEWEKPALSRAYQAAQECWFEITLPGPGEPTAIATEAWARGIDPNRRLPALLSGAEHARLHSRIAALNIPGSAELVDSLRPWMVHLLIVLGDARTSGMEGRNGVDRVLEARARKDGKRVVALETAADQVAVFADQPEGATLLRLRAALAAPPPAPGPGMDTLVRHWLDGDLDWLAGHMDETGRRLGPGIADALLARRNRAWATRIAALKGRTGRPRTILVTVGAAHLAGPGSLVDLLRTNGFTVERTQP